MAESVPTTTTLYNLEEYTFGIGAKKQKSHSSQASDVAARRRARFQREGTRRSVRAVVLVHSHEHPHVLLLQRKEDGALRLPGGALRPGEEDQAGLARKLSAQLASASLDPPQWDVGLFLGQLWRAAPFDDDALDADHTLFPYIAPHVSKPRECVKVFLVSLPVSQSYLCTHIYSPASDNSPPSPNVLLLFRPNTNSLPFLSLNCTTLPTLTFRPTSPLSRSGSRAANSSASERTHPTSFLLSSFIVPILHQS